MSQADFARRQGFGYIAGISARRRQIAPSVQQQAHKADQDLWDAQTRVLSKRIAQPAVSSIVPRVGEGGGAGRRG